MSLSLIHIWLSSEAAVMQAVRNSKMLVSGVSKQMIARAQDRDAGEVVRRIPGITIIDDKFIVARGLSQRYNNCLLYTSRCV